MLCRLAGDCGGCWEKTNGVTADEGELICKAFVLKALWPGSLIKVTSYVLTSLGEHFSPSTAVICAAACSPSATGLNTVHRPAWWRGVIVAASLLICSLTC